MGTTSQPARRGGPDGVAVRARALTLRHDATVAVAEANLDIPTGRVTAIIGPNGSGKSTLLRAVSGLHSPTRGELAVLGAPASAGRRDVAHVLQATATNAALPVTVTDVVRMGRWAAVGPFHRLSRADHDLVDQALARMGLDDLRDRHLGELSGGQRQRVLVAQGLAQGAELLLLDEPTTGLDLPSRQRIDDIAAEEVAAGRTVVMTTHDVETAAAAHHVVLLATDVVSEGPPEHALTSANLEAAYGGHLHELPSGALVLDDPAPHHHGHH